MNKNELKELIEKQMGESIKDLTNKDIKNLVKEFVVFREGNESLSYNLFSRYNLQQCINFIEEVMMSDIKYFLELLELFE